MKTQQRRQELKETLITVGIGTIERKGLSALRARDLAKEAGCALGAIYNVFPDLDTLILAINSRTMEMLEQHLSQFSVPLPHSADGVARQAAREQLVALALGYLDFADRNLLRWRALFEHRIETRQNAPEWYVDMIAKLFAFIERPVSILKADLDEAETALLSRSLFSAAHGMVALGLEEKIGTIPLERLHDQIRYVVDTMAVGLIKNV